MQTYYELEDYHWDQIKREGYTKGTEVWFIKSSLNSDDLIEKGTITGHDITIEGDILLKIEVEKEEKSDVFDTNENRKIKTNYEAYMSFSYFSEEKAIKRLKNIFKSKIKSLESRIEYYNKKLEELGE